MGHSELRRATCALVLSAVAWVACGDDDGTTMMPPPGGDTCIPARHGGGGYMRTVLSGGYEQTIDWGPETQCGGNSDIANGQFQMAMGHDITAETMLSFLWTVTATEGATGTGFAAKVTIGGNEIGDAASVPDGGCSMDITEHSLLQTEVTGRLYRVTATGRCTQGADPIRGMVNIDIGDFEIDAVTVWTGTAP